MGRCYNFVGVLITIDNYVWFLEPWSWAPVEMRQFRFSAENIKTGVNALVNELFFVGMLTDCTYSSVATCEPISISHVRGCNPLTLHSNLPSQTCS